LKESIAHIKKSVELFIIGCTCQNGTDGAVVNDRLQVMESKTIREADASSCLPLSGNTNAALDIMDRRKAADLILQMKKKI